MWLKYIVNFLIVNINRALKTDVLYKTYLTLMRIFVQAPSCQTPNILYIGGFYGFVHMGV